MIVPAVIEIGSAVKKGRNRLEVKVANLWINRLIGPVRLLGQGR